MQVLKRNGECQGVDFNKITIRLQKLCDEGQLSVDPIAVAQRVCSAIHNKITTRELDRLAADIAASLGTSNIDYMHLAGRIVASDIQKNVRWSFTEIMQKLHSQNKISDETLEIANKHADAINKCIDYARDYNFDYFALKTLERGYLYQIADNIVERPQDMFMRVSIGIHGDDIAGILDSYNMMSEKYMTHATPTLFNAGSNRAQMSSCFLLGTPEDSISGIFKSLSDCAHISKLAGGIGMHIHNIRSKGASINGTKGACSGIVPMLKIFNDTARYVNQEGKRPGSIAVYLQVDHPDIFDFLDLKKNTGDEESRARDLFYALWIPDLFMERVKNDQNWSLFCPRDAPQLSELYGDDYVREYTKLENEGLAKKTIAAQDLWKAICDAQMETGTPYMLYKDAVNNKSNQKNLGTIKNSNLCTEIVQFTSPEEVAVCNLASICLPRFVENQLINFTKLEDVVYKTTIALNKVIDRNFYPVPEAHTSNMRHRPIGIGVQGLADLYALMRVPFDSTDAAEINKAVFETMYYSAMRASCDLAKKHGPYSSFRGSPLSKGKFQFDLWNVKPCKDHDWDSLRKDVMQYGARNSLLLAPMPTATTSQIMGNNECFEPYTSNLYVRRTLAGEFTIINKHLVNDLVKANLWSTGLKDQIVAHNGSVQNIDTIPKDIKDLYKTAWEISQKVIIEQAADRGAYICQSQSMNLFVPRPSVKILSSMHFYAWSKGLKTGMYYLRTKPAADPIKFTICESCSG